VSPFQGAEADGGYYITLSLELGRPFLFTVLCAKIQEATHGCILANIVSGAHVVVETKVLAAFDIAQCDNGKDISGVSVVAVDIGMVVGRGDVRIIGVVEVREGGSLAHCNDRASDRRYRML
jgi:hypothetical protein